MDTGPKLSRYPLQMIEWFTILFTKKHQLSSGTASLVLCTLKLQQGGRHPTLPDTSDLPSIVDGYAVFTSPDKADIIQLTNQVQKRRE